MITAIHTLIYSDDPQATRAFLRDVLELKNLEFGEGSGWLIFKTGPSELGVHPTHSEYEGKIYDLPRHHSISLMCENLEETVAKLRAQGAQFNGEIVDHGYGPLIMLNLPGAGEIQLYQPNHALAINL